MDLAISRLYSTSSTGSEAFSGEERSLDDNGEDTRCVKFVKRSSLLAWAPVVGVTRFMGDRYTGGRGVVME